MLSTTLKLPKTGEPRTRPIQQSPRQDRRTFRPIGLETLQTAADSSACVKQLSQFQTRADSVLQRSPVDTDFGTFTDIEFETVNEDKEDHHLHGVDMRLEFMPKAGTPTGAHIGLTQTVDNMGDDEPDVDPGLHTEVATPGGLAIDRSDVGGYDNTTNNPIYGSEPADLFNKKDPATALFDPDHRPDKAQGNDLGYYQPAEKVEAAKLYDTPRRYKNKKSHQLFETTALVVEGEAKGTYLGSVTWGYEATQKNAITKHPLTVKSKGSASNKFFEAARSWNEDGKFAGSKTKIPSSLIKLPIPADGGGFEEGTLEPDYQVPVDVAPVAVGNNTGGKKKFKFKNPFKRNK